MVSVLPNETHFMCCFVLSDELFTFLVGPGNEKQISQ